MIMSQANPALFPNPFNYTYDEWLWASLTFQTRGYVQCTSEENMKLRSRLGRLVDPRFQDQLTYVLVPLFDMLDHSTIISMDDKVLNT